MEPADRDLLHSVLDVLEDDAALAKATPDPDAEPDYPRMAEQARIFIAKAEAAQHDRALATLGAHDPQPARLAKSAAAPGDLAALARLARSVELRERIAAQPPADHRGRLPWQVNAETATVDETVAMVEQLAAAG